MLGRLPMMLAAACALASGCGTGPERYGGEPLLYEGVAKGGRIVVQRELMIPAGKRLAYLENGELFRARYEVSKWGPYCELQVHESARRATVIQPDEFTVTKVEHNEQPELGDIHTFYTRISLASPRQPAVSTLTCGVRGAYQDTRHITLEQFEQSVGDYVAIR